MSVPPADPALRQVDAPRPRLDARTTAWLIRQRERAQELDLEVKRLESRLDASERIERAAQRYADRLEEKLDVARKRETTLARALGYAEGQRDQLARRLEAGTAPAPELGAQDRGKRRWRRRG